MYIFNEGDVRSCLSFLVAAALGGNGTTGRWGRAPVLDWTTLRYVTCEMLWGGHVTDDVDQRVLASLGERYVLMTNDQ